MVQFIPVIFLIFSLNVRADFFGFGSEEGYESAIPALVEKIKKLEMKNNPGFEDTFNQEIKNIENSLETEKLFCSGEASDNKGRVLPRDKKQLCFRELKGHYLEAVETIFNVKKKYLALIHAEQIQKLGEIQTKLKADIEKNF